MFLIIEAMKKQAQSCLPHDPKDLSSEELQSYKIFHTNALNRSGVDPFVLATEVGLNIPKIPKDSALAATIWICYLSINSENLLHCSPTQESSLKYKTFESFVSQYPKFKGPKYPNEELFRLFYVANWLNIFFRFVPARKNKGLCLQVVPRIVEGWEAKYITGSGQTSATTDRVHIYEVEGNIKRFQRSGRDSKKASLPKNISILEPSVSKAKAPKQATKSRKRFAEYSSKDNNPVGRPRADSDGSAIPFLPRESSEANSLEMNTLASSYDTAVRENSNAEEYIVRAPSFDSLLPSWNIGIVDPQIDDLYTSAHQMMSGVEAFYPNFFPRTNSCELDENDTPQYMVPRTLSCSSIPSMDFSVLQDLISD